MKDFPLIEHILYTEEFFIKYEYTLLECIRKTRSKGIPTSGNDGLSKICNMNS
jgi:hypothetical protein